ncbi:hypothetical protein PCL_08602 [Purpureocillium lilacinum]|uniref:Uncharacterized protein n=1 Tax=Purpureocillium lilacinum TaxID=33203 RepID=A0A2U3DR57_PURLI|nr:hypothetical protein PCL_08602 [Purpureocillium lilacinum]
MDFQDIGNKLAAVFAEAVASQPQTQAPVDVETKIDIVSNKFDNLSGKFDNLGGKFDNLGGELGSLGRNLRDLTTAVTALNHVVTALHTDLQSLGQSVNRLDSNIAGLNATVCALDTAVIEGNQRIEKLDTTVIEGNQKIEKDLTSRLQKIGEKVGVKKWHSMHSDQVPSVTPSGLLTRVRSKGRSSVKRKRLRLHESIKSSGMLWLSRDYSRQDGHIALATPIELYIEKGREGPDKSIRNS